MKLEMDEKDIKKLFLIKELHGLDSFEDAFVWALRKVEVTESAFDWTTFKRDLDKIPRIKPGSGLVMVDEKPNASEVSDFHGIEIKLGKY